MKEKNKINAYVPCWSSSFSLRTKHDTEHFCKFHLNQNNDVMSLLIEAISYNTNKTLMIKNLMI